MSGAPYNIESAMPASPSRSGFQIGGDSGKPCSLHHRYDLEPGRTTGGGRNTAMPLNMLASLAALATGVFWGVYWIPARRLEAVALQGAWSAVAAAAVAMILLAPLALPSLVRRARAGDAPIGAGALFGAGLAGASFMVYAIGLLYGKVAVVILLFYLTPVWSTILGRLRYGWPISPPRAMAIVIGLAGMLVVLSGPTGLPFPANVGEWLGLIGGVMWTFGSTSVHTDDGMKPLEATFLFCAGAVVTATVLAIILSGAPQPALDAQATTAGLWVVATGVVWWCGSILMLMWATQQLEPARVGILLMSEVLVGVVSAALLAREPFGWPEAIGGLMVIAAGLIEVWPVRQPSADGAPSNGS
ncbi:DMT family transporter [Ferruginivarius sediminum]|uniref:DMT family transporter n=2 Tax=Ferruginivarius sediminum TaxID=2661937 RepID=A0A369TDI0_9PROT|nr:DMT family transporter [Ferruginivarius sediminum]